MGETPEAEDKHALGNDQSEFLDPVRDVLRQGCPLLRENRQTSGSILADMAHVNEWEITDAIEVERRRAAAEWKRKEGEVIGQGITDRKRGKVTIYSVLVTLLLFGSIGFAIWQNWTGGTWQGAAPIPPPATQSQVPASVAGGTNSRGLLIKWLNGRTMYRLRPVEVEEARNAIKADEK